jgi:hypothetical protein
VASEPGISAASPSVSCYGDGDGGVVVVALVGSGDGVAWVGWVGSGDGPVVVAWLGPGELPDDSEGGLDELGPALVGGEGGALVGVDPLLPSVGVPVGDGVAVEVPDTSGGASWRIATISALNPSRRVEISERE